MSAKWHSKVYEKPQETQNLSKLGFLKAVIVLGRPKWILEEFGTFLRNLEFFLIFSSLLDHFLQGFWILGQKMSAKWPFKVYEKPKKSPKFELTWFFEGCSCFGTPKMDSRGVWNLFEKFWNFGDFSDSLGHFLQEFWIYFVQNYPKLPSEVYETPRNSEFQIFLKAAVVLGALKMDSGGVQRSGTCLEKFK